MLTSRLFTFDIILPLKLSDSNINKLFILKVTGILLSNSDIVPVKEFVLVLVYPIADGIEILLLLYM